MNLHTNVNTMLYFSTGKANFSLSSSLKIFLYLMFLMWFYLREDVKEDTLN